MNYACPVAIRTPFAGLNKSSAVIPNRIRQLNTCTRSTFGSVQPRPCINLRRSETLSCSALRGWSREFTPSSVTAARKRWIKTPETPARPEQITKRRSPRTWQDYDPNVGIPLETGELDQATITRIFGPDLDETFGNHVLRLVNYRRISGSLIDVGTEFPPESNVSRDAAAAALQYLRETYPDFDEQGAGAAWAEAEVERVEQEYLTRAEDLGIYRKTPEEEAASEAQTERKKVDVYGESALDGLRRANVARWKREDKKKEELREQQRLAELARLKESGEEPKPEQQQRLHRDTASQTTQASSDALHLQQPVGKAWLQPVERKSWVKYYEEQATIIKDNKIPQLSLLRRLGPSALVVLCVIGGCLTLHEMYAPPPKSARVFPEIPPAIATLATITAINFATFVAWRIPFLWRTMNKYFLVSPGYPFALGIFGAQFGHQSLTHLFTNTILLWPFGLMLHDDVGRGTFLAIYLGCGTIGAYGSLVYHVLRQRWLYYIFGSSTAVLGTMAATCLLRADHDVTIMGYQVPMTGMTFLGLFGGLQVLSAWKGTKMGVDYSGHLSGMAAGIAAAWYIRRQAAKTEMTREDYVGQNSTANEAER
ncbi:hypothetical protein AAFC00_005404 [Neodothiora populina]|uniref:Peptidase S54 rhomboid domain-containing protein n=1 Tax=Neodothiora populina TaxID=2781224 RepID=A0ABR3PL49_9PEZI